MKLSVLIITYKRINQLERCLDSLFGQISLNLGEVLVCVNGDDSQSAKMLAKKRKKFPGLKYWKKERLSRGAARNNLAKQASGEIICFLDDDIVLGRDSVEVLLKAAEQYPQAAIFGGPNLCFPGSDNFQISQSKVLGSFLGSAWMSRRYKGGKDIFDADERCLALCNLAIRRKVFSLSKSAFNENLISCEENLLLRQMSAQGLKAVFLSKFIVFHQRRKTYRGLCRQIFQYGQGRMQAIRIAPEKYDFIFLVPAIFFLYLILLPLLAETPKLLLPLAIYFFLIAAVSLKIIFQLKSFKIFPLILIIFLLVHICYGAGFIFEFLFKKSSLKTIRL
jgi:glycosyltransferase involved in cell wall biosynthesis